MLCVAYQIPVAFFSLQKISSFLRRWCPYCIILCLALLAKNLQNLPLSSAHGLVKSLKPQKIRNYSCILPSYFTTFFRPQLGSWCWDRSARRFTLYFLCPSDRRPLSWCMYRLSLAWGSVCIVSYILFCEKEACFFSLYLANRII